MGVNADEGNDLAMQCFDHHHITKPVDNGSASANIIVIEAERPRILLV